MNYYKIQSGYNNGFMNYNNNNLTNYKDNNLANYTKK